MVKGMTAEELHRTVETWLRHNSCTIKESKPPRSIVAYFPANVTMFKLGLRDDYPKNIEVNIGSFGRSATMDITFTQELPRMGEAGFLYWGSRLEMLYRKLDILVDRFTLAELYPPEWVHRVISRTLKMYAAFMVLSLTLYALTEVTSDWVVTYVAMIVLPATLMAALDINEHMQLLNRMMYK
jgi:hypothetical protein